MNEPLTTEDLLALAVLQRKGPAAIRMLLDLLADKYSDGKQRIEPITNFAKLDTENIQGLVFFDATLPNGDIVDIDVENTQVSLMRWLDQGGVLALTGVNRVELYKFTPPKRLSRLDRQPRPYTMAELQDMLGTPIPHLPPNHPLTNAGGEVPQDTDEDEECEEDE